VNINHKILSSLLISNPIIEEIVNICKEYGVASKFTGAGWGGSVVGIITTQQLEKSPTLLLQLTNALKVKGYQLFCDASTCIGLRRET